MLLVTGTNGGEDHCTDVTKVDIEEDVEDEDEEKVLVLEVRNSGMIAIQNDRTNGLTFLLLAVFAHGVDSRFGIGEVFEQDLVL